MPDEWISMTAAIGRISRATGIKPDSAISILLELGRTGRLSGRINKAKDGNSTEPQRSVTMTDEHWNILSSQESGDWFRSNEVHFDDENFWLGLEVFADDLEREVGPVAASDDTSWVSAFAPACTYITLSEALSWIAFKNSMDKDQLEFALSDELDSAKREAIEEALEELTDAAIGSAITLRGKTRGELPEGELVHEQIGVDELAVCRKFTPGADSLHPGAGLESQDQSCGEARFVEVRVNRAELLELFPPEQAASAKQVESKSNAETECKEWLEKEFTNNDNDPQPKSWFQEKALKKYKGRLTQRGFWRAWDKVAPGYGRTKPGRKKKS